MRSHNLPLLADVFRQALLRSGDLWFAIDALLSEYDADQRRAAAAAAGKRARNPLPHPVRLRPYRQAQEFRPLVEAVAGRHGVSMADLLGPSRADRFLHPRQEAMWVVRHARVVPVRFTVVAAALGRSHRTTAIAGVRQFEARLATDPALRARVTGEGIPKAETGGGVGIAGAAVDRREGSGEAPVVQAEGRLLGPAVGTADGGPATGGLSASPAKPPQEIAACP